MELKSKAMKTKVIIAVVMSIFLSSYTAQAKSRLVVNANPSQKILESELQRALKTFDYSSFMERGEQENISLIFKVKDDTQLEVIHVIGNDYNMTREVERLLTQQVVRCDTCLRGNMYRINLNFKHFVFAE